MLDHPPQLFPTLKEESITLGLQEEKAKEETEEQSTLTKWYGKLVH